MNMDQTPARLSRRQEKSILLAAAEVARSEFDSPQRIGCPQSETLKLLARRSSSLAESLDLIDHIGTCSPCFVEYSRYRSDHKRRIRIYSWVASAAAIVLLGFILIHLFPGGQPSISRNEIARGGEPLARILDLRMSSVPRGDTPAPQAAVAPRLPRARLDLSIYLPVGSEEGIYEIALVSASGQSVLTSSGEAKLQNFVDALTAKLDLAGLRPGPYELRLRRVQGQWNSYPIALE
jgi:hypothetical protein